jgi:hypothetical protein
MAAKTTPAPKKKTAKIPAPKRKIREYPRIEGTELAKLHIDSGWLYHLNRTFYHPLGFSMIYEETPSGEMLPVLLDRRSNPTGVFSPKEMESGEAKKQSYLNEFGRATLERRRKALGFTVQPSETT